MNSFNIEVFEKKGVVVWFVSTLEDTLFLKEFLKYYNGKVVVFHLNLITRLDMVGFDVKHMYPISFDNYPINQEMKRSFNVLAGRLSIIEASNSYYATIDKLNKLPLNEKMLFVIPSGRHVHHIAGTHYCEKNAIPKVYINYANFPGFLFLDPKGTDALSSIYKNPVKLDQMFDYTPDTKLVFQRFTSIKESQKSIPQATGNKTKAFIKKIAFKINGILERLIGFHGDRKVRILGDRVKKEFDGIKYDQIDCFENTIFFPLQVSTDQQVLLNYSGGSIFKAIEEALEIATAEEKNLIVREHPAEANKSEIRVYLNQLRLKYKNFKVSDLSVQVLLDSCQNIITINSTVGLEAKLKGKDVRFLGNSFYAKATDSQIAKYLERYFFPVDYHQPQMNRKLVGQLLSYAYHEDV